MSSAGWGQWPPARGWTNAHSTSAEHASGISGRPRSSCSRARGAVDPNRLSSSREVSRGLARYARGRGWGEFAASLRITVETLEAHAISAISDTTCIYDKNAEILVHTCRFSRMSVCAYALEGEGGGAEGEAWPAGSVHGNVRHDLASRAVGTGRQLARSDARLHGSRSDSPHPDASPCSSLKQVEIRKFVRTSFLRCAHVQID